MKQFPQRIRVAGAVGVALISVIGGGAVWAAAPVAFNNWALSGGSISSTCPSGFTCKDPITGAGFFQREIFNPTTDKRYLQTIITSNDATAAATLGTDLQKGFSDENFVLKHGLANPSASIKGLADHQVNKARSTDPAVVRDFDSTTTINSGWASGPGLTLFSTQQNFAETQVAPRDFTAGFKLDIFGNSIGGRDRSDLDIQQWVKDPGMAPGNEFDTVFHYMDKKDSLDNVQGNRLALSQNIGLGYPKLLTLEDEGNNKITIATGGLFHSEERQVFFVRQSGGTMKASSDPLWIYHWQSTGEDGRQMKPLRGQWFGCRSTSHSDQCQDYSKHETLSAPSLPFDPLPFTAAVGHHSREADKGLYTYNGTVANGSMKDQLVVPGPLVGGNAAPLPTPRKMPAPTPSVNGQSQLLNWAVNNGEIGIVCPTGFSCSTLARDAGFVQVKLVKTATGETYYETIGTAANATGNVSSLAFYNEAAIKQLPQAQQTTFSGIAARTKVANSSQVMDMETQLRTGWAANDATPDIEVHQVMSWTKFDFLANNNNVGARTGSKLDMIQHAKNSKEKLDEQIFIHSEYAGDMLTTAGKATLPGNKVVSWLPGDDVRVTFMTVGNDPTSYADPSNPKDSTTGPTGNDRRDWNQGWGGWRISYLFYDNYSDNKQPEGLVTPKDKPGWIFWTENPFGSLKARVDSTQGGFAGASATASLGVNSIDENKGGSWTPGGSGLVSGSLVK
ncbi:MAG: hypothetical protein HY272_07040 [Gammaproteobacteria bacterium]|nr:hypothetical protein [Gammaproteobacteria bacterium]